VAPGGNQPAELDIFIAVDDPGEPRTHDLGIVTARALATNVAPSPPDETIQITIVENNGTRRQIRVFPDG